MSYRNNFRAMAALLGIVLLPALLRAGVPPEAIAKLRLDAAAGWNNKLAGLKQANFSKESTLCDLRMSRSMFRIFNRRELVAAMVLQPNAAPADYCRFEGPVGSAMGIPKPSHPAIEFHFAGDGEIYETKLTAMWNPENDNDLLVEYAEHRLSGWTTIQLVQQSQPSAVSISLLHECVCGETLAANDIPGEGSVIAVGRSWEELRGAHSAEYQRYVVPSLDKLISQAELYRTNDDLIAAVLAPAFVAPPAVTARVQSLLQNLDADAYRTREATDRALRSAPAEEKLCLFSLDRSAWSPERSVRVDNILNSVIGNGRSPTELFNDPAFLIDCQLSDAPILRLLAMQRLHELRPGLLPMRLQTSAKRRCTSIQALQDLFPAPIESAEAPRSFWYAEPTDDNS